MAQRESGLVLIAQRQPAGQPLALSEAETPVHPMVDREAVSEVDAPLVEGFARGPVAHAPPALRIAEVGGRGIENLHHPVHAVAPQAPVRPLVEQAGVVLEALRNGANGCVHADLIQGEPQPRLGQLGIAAAETVRLTFGPGLIAPPEERFQARQIVVPGQQVSVAAEQQAFLLRVERVGPPCLNQARLQGVRLAPALMEFQGQKRAFGADRRMRLEPASETGIVQDR